MPKNRDYTGLVRTPSSMAWLIRERSVLKGEIDRLEKQQAQIPERLEQLNASLRALDTVFPLHEVKIEPGVIAGRRPKSKSITPYGGMLRSIYGFFRDNNSKDPIFTSEIALHVMREHQMPMDHASKQLATRRVLKQLGKLAKSGELIRHHALTIGNREEGSWSLPPDIE